VKSLGYAQTFTRLCDAGGTLFSDILMGMDSVIAETDINNSLYEKDKDLGELKYIISRIPLKMREY
jgi:hypothetical protein